MICPSEKLQSDTPRTDAVLASVIESDYPAIVAHDFANFARQLERELWEEKDATGRMFGRYIEASQRADNAEMLMKAAQSAITPHQDTARMDFMERFLVEGTWTKGEHEGRVAWLADAECLRETIDAALSSGNEREGEA